MKNEIANKLLLEGDKFIPEMHLRQPGVHMLLVDHLRKTKKESITFNKQNIDDIFIKTN